MTVSRVEPGDARVQGKFDQHDQADGDFRGQRIAVMNLGWPLIFIDLLDDLCGGAGDYGVCGDILGDHRTRGDDGIITD